MAALPAPQTWRERVVLGGRFGEEDESVSYARLDAFAESGGRWVDTAHSYAGGRSERVIGRWLGLREAPVRLIDKIGHPDHDGRLDLAAEALRAETEESLRRLGRDSVDVLMLHRDDPARPVSAMAEALLDLVERGYATATGVSNWPAPRLAELESVYRQAGHVPVVSYQHSLATPVSPLWPGTRHADEELLGLVLDRQLPFLAWAGQARGFFAGRSEPVRPGGPDPFDSPVNRSRRRRCTALAADLGTTPDTVALAWSLHRSHAWPVVGARSVAEVARSMAAAELRLDAVTVRWLERGADSAEN